MNKHNQKQICTRIYEDNQDKLDFLKKYLKETTTTSTLNRIIELYYFHLTGTNEVNVNMK